MVYFLFSLWLMAGYITKNADKLTSDSGTSWNYALD